MISDLQNGQMHGVGGGGGAGGGAGVGTSEKSVVQNHLFRYFF